MNVSQIILAGLKQKLTGNAILQTLKNNGLGYRRQVFYQDLAKLKGVAQKMGRGRFTPLKYRPDAKNYIPEEGAYLDKYRHTLQYDIHDMHGEYQGQGFISISNNNQYLTRKELEEYGQQVMTGNDNYQRFNAPVSFSNFTLDSSYINTLQA